MEFNVEKFVADMNEFGMGVCSCGKPLFVIPESVVVEDGYIFCSTGCADGHLGDTRFIRMSDYL